MGQHFKIKIEMNNKTFGTKFTEIGQTLVPSSVRKKWGWNFPLPFER